MGGVLRSELEFPELNTVESKRPDWTLRVVHSTPPLAASVPLGQRQLGAESYHLARTQAGFRLEYSHAGWFDISHDGSSMVWYPGHHAREELARAIVLGPAMAIALETAGYLCLHGSAVAWGSEAVGFVGPKHYGKSTLALALTAAGGRLVSDDLIAIWPGPPATVRPGVPSARLWEDAARELSVESRYAHVIRGVKTTVTGLEQRQPLTQECTLAAIYVLDPVQPHTLAAACRRLALLGTDAAVALAHQTKLADPLIGYSAAGAQLKSAVAIAAHVPIWTLSIVRDFTQLQAVTEQILHWHQTSAASVKNS